MTGPLALSVVHMQVTRELVGAALGGDSRASALLVRTIEPVVRSRVLRQFLAMRRNAAGKGGIELADLVQDVFAVLYAHDGRLLRKWDPARGLSWRNWIGLVSQRAIRARMRSYGGDSVAWEAVQLESCTLPVEPWSALEAKNELARISADLENISSPRVRDLMRLLWLDEEEASVVAERSGMTEQAVYAARARLRRRMRQLAKDAKP